MGVVIIGISFFLQTGTITSDVLLVSIPTSVLIGAILMANNIRDLEDDKQHGRRTLAILLKRDGANRCLAAMFAFSYLWIIGLVATGIVSPWAFAAFASLPKAFEASRGFWRSTAPQDLMPAMVATAKTNTIFGFCLTLGLLLHYWQL
jgi:1,4-dihydroxy-2-naphthoate octaprenyltransferase